jgi:hypothetical protein
MSLRFPVWTALRMQAAVLIVGVAVDRAFAATFAVPAWLLPVRVLLTAVGAACLFVASCA